MAVNRGKHRKAGRDTYSLEKSRGLFSRLAGAAQVVILRGAHPAGAEAARALAEGEGVLLARLLPLDGLAGAVSEMDTLVFPCTGVLRLAQAVRTPSVALCRQFNYDVWRPLEAPHRSLVGAKGEAIDEIPPERVAEEVRSLLGVGGFAGAGEGAQALGALARWGGARPDEREGQLHGAGACGTSISCLETPLGDG
ncbi:MAG: glycosyltransferase family 9 protein [Deferrisomatales bacterium]